MMTDINNMPLRGPDPDEIDTAEAEEQALLDYLQDWIDGEIVNDGAYADPIRALADEPCIFELVGADSDEELLAAAKEIRGILRREILGQLEGDA